MAMKIIRQANQIGGNGPEIEQVPPNRSLSPNASMELLQVNSFSTPTHAHAQKISYMRRRIYMQSSSKKEYDQKIMDRFFSNWVRRNSGDLQLDLTHANCIAKFYKSRVHAQDMGGVSIAISTEQQASKW